MFFGFFFGFDFLILFSGKKNLTNKFSRRYKNDGIILGNMILPSMLELNYKENVPKMTVSSLSHILWAIWRWLGKSCRGRGLFIHPSHWDCSHVLWPLVSESEDAQSCLTLCDPWTVAHQAPLSMGFSRQEYWSGLPFPSPGDLPNPGIEPGSPALQADALTSEPPGKPLMWPLVRLVPKRQKT